MEGFETKKALLEYLGKNPDDRKLVDRLLARGSVRMEEGMYCTNLRPVAVWDVEANHELEDLCSKLRKRISELEKKLEEKPETLTVSNGAVQAFDEARAKLMEQDLEEAKAQWKYYEELAEKRAVLMEKVVHETYVIAKSKLWGKMEDEPDFRAAIIRRAKGINED